MNHVPQALDITPATWGDLLAQLDEQAAGQGRLLTIAKFDGVEEPSFRDPDVTARRLHDVRRVEVETATPGVFLRLILADTLDPLDRAAASTKDLSTRYRGRDLAGCHDDLKTLATELRGLTSLVAMLGGPLQMDLGPCTVDGMTVAQQLEQLAQSLDALVTAQESEDWLTVADVLEYDIEPAILRWREMILTITVHLERAA